MAKTTGKFTTNDEKNIKGFTFFILLCIKWNKSGGKMAAKDLLVDVYQKFYEQKEVLSEAPPLTQNPQEPSFNSDKAEEELRKVISYLMGVPDVQELPFEKIIDIIREHYSNQPEWKNLLIDYFIYTAEKKKEALEKRQDEIVKESNGTIKKIII